MKKYARSLSLSLALSSVYYSLLACSCGVYIPLTYCGTLSLPSNNNTVLVEILEAGWLVNRPFYDVKILEEFHFDIPADTIRVIDQEGINCGLGGLISYLSPQDTVLFTLNSYLENQTKFWLNTCGVYHLLLKNDTLRGAINHGVDQIAYSDFRSSIEECETTPTRIKISGGIRSWFESTGLSNFSVEVSGANILTNDRGNYEAYAQSEEGRDFLATFHKESNILEGLSAIDLVQMTNFILGKVQPNIYQVAAADVDGSQSITTLDILHVKRVLLGRADSFPINKTWQFIDTRIFFSGLPPNPWHYIEQLSSPISVEFFDSSINVVAIKIGDVDGSWFSL